MPTLGNNTSSPSSLLTIKNTGDVGIGTTNPQGTLHIKNSPMWSSANYGANLLIDGNRNNSIAILDANSSNPIAITNNFGKLLFSKMPTLGNNTSSPSSLLTIKNTGDIGIGTTNPDMKLTVNGNIHAKEVKIDLSIPAPDYVFKENYNLRSIEDVEKFIKKNNHLPEIPSAKEFEKNGIMQAEMDMNLLKKIEELTLYTIQQQKEITEQKEKVQNLEKENEVLKRFSERLAKVEEQLKNKN
jgi:archaellum component FlaG (FlaF/FlaG flagellin family)